MHMLPSSHGTGVFPHDAPEGHHIDYGMVTLPNPNDVRIYHLTTPLNIHIHKVVPVILQPGDALVFHGETAHYTPPNISNSR